MPQLQGVTTMENVAGASNNDNSKSNQLDTAVLPSHARPSSTTGIKNKAPAAIQVTAEQLLREAWDRKEPSPSLSALPKLRIADAEELAEYQREERKTFEQRIVRNRSHTPLWIKYARWEEEQRDFVRTRSIWERAIDNDYRNPAIWIQYAEFEMRHRFINHARNVFDRSIALLPRCNDLWLRYTHMEEILKRKDLTRNIFHRWLKWFPDSLAYFAFIRFELRDDSISTEQQSKNIRSIYHQLVQNFPAIEMYLKFAKFEERNNHFSYARKIYEMVSENLSSTDLSPAYFIAFAKFEVRRKQIERARAIYKFALNHFTKSEQPQKENDIQLVNKSYTEFEKQYGSINELDSILINNKRTQYQQKLLNDPTDYESWYELIKLEEQQPRQDTNKIKELYEKAISNKPREDTKSAWNTYVYLWLLYASWLELENNNNEQNQIEVINIYKRCIAIVPTQHKKFSFAKLWIQYAHTEIRNENLSAARKIFGTALGILPWKHKIYHEYIQMEIAIGDIERAREIFSVWLTRHPTYIKAFVSLSELEQKLGENERAIAVLELATKIYQLSTNSLARDSDFDDDVDMDDDIEIDEIWSLIAKVTANSFDRDEAVGRFESYIEQSQKKGFDQQSDQYNDDDRFQSADTSSEDQARQEYQIWTAYIVMMKELDEEDKAIRGVFDRAFEALEKQAKLSNSTHEQASKARLLDMTEAWLTWETSLSSGTDNNVHIANVKQRMPRRTTVNGKTTITLSDSYGTNDEPKEQSSSAPTTLGNLLLAAAHKWKEQTQK